MVKRSTSASGRRTKSSARGSGRGAGAAKAARRVLRAGLAVAWVAGLVLALLLLGRELMTSERFAVAEVRVHGVQRALHDEIVALADVHRGANVFQVDATAGQERVEAHPWVRSARVRRELPRRVVITVTEYEPKALVSAGELYLVDGAGRVIKVYEPGDPTAFPIVTGLTRDTVEADQSALEPALALLDSWSRRGLPELSEVMVRGPAGLAARTSDGTMVRLGRAPYEAKLVRLERILSSPDTRNAVSIRLDGERRDDRATIILSPAGRQGGR